MPYIELNDIRIFYILHKTSATNKPGFVVLIHGVGGNHLSMLSIFNHIRKKYGKLFNILVFDLPHHFRSCLIACGADNTAHLAIPISGGINYYAKIMNVLLKKLFGEYNAFILIGHSMGAQICIKYASLFPHAVEKAMLIAGCHETRVRDGFIKSLEKSFDRTINIFLKDALATKNENVLNNALADIKRTDPRITVNDFKYIQYFSEHYDIDINHINADNIFFDLICSKEDKVVKYDCVERLHRKIANSEIHEIDSENHMGFLYKNPSTEKEIDRFLLTRGMLKL